MTKQIGYNRSIDEINAEVEVLLTGHSSKDQTSIDRILASHPEFAESGPDVIAAAIFDRPAARLVTAREYGFATWRQLEVYVDRSPSGFQHLACLRYDSSDRPDNWEQARSLLKTDPTLGTADIWSAACAGNAEVVHDILAMAPEMVDQRGGHFDWEPLLYACYSRLGEGSTLEVARALLSAGADPNAHYMWAGQYRFSALTGAFGEGEMGPSNQPAHEACEALATLLLDAGAHPNESQGLYNRMFTQGTEVLELLLRYGLSNKDRNNWLVEADGKLVKHPEETLAYQLRWAILNHHVDRARLLIDNGASLDDDPESGKSLFELAHLRGHPELAEYLAAHGARAPEIDPIDQFVSALTAGDGASARGLRTEARVRETERRYPSLVIDTAAAGRSEAIAVMAGAGLTLNRMTHRAPLHEAAWAGHLEVVRLLVDLGASPRERDEHHAATPLQFALTAGQDEVAAYLVDCDIDVFDAIAAGSASRLRTLLEQDPSQLEQRLGKLRADEQDHAVDWMSPLAFAATRDEGELVDVLLELGADISVAKPSGSSLTDVLKEAGAIELASRIEGAGHRVGN